MPCIIYRCSHGEYLTTEKTDVKIQSFSIVNWKVLELVLQAQQPVTFTECDICLLRKTGKNEEE